MGYWIAVLIVLGIKVFVDCRFEQKFIRFVEVDGILWLKVIGVLSEILHFYFLNWKLFVLNLGYLFIVGLFGLIDFITKLIDEDFRFIFNDIT